MSLHRHINLSYKFDSFTHSFVEILAAQETPTDTSWYQGTADAVRQNLRDFLQHPYEYYVILSGDQLYRMDYGELLAQHIKTKAKVTLATLPVTRANAQGFGIMHTDAERKIIEFVEKPQDPAVLDELRIPPALQSELGEATDAALYQASMDIYVFNRQTLIDALANDSEIDFGKHIIPRLIRKRPVMAYIFQGYWEDLGTIRAFFDANLMLTDPIPRFNFFDTVKTIYTHARYLRANRTTRTVPDGQRKAHELSN